MRPGCRCGCGIVASMGRARRWPPARSKLSHLHAELIGPTPDQQGLALQRLLRLLVAAGTFVAGEQRHVQLHVHP